MICSDQVRLAALWPGRKEEGGETAERQRRKEQLHPLLALFLSDILPGRERGPQKNEIHPGLGGKGMVQKEKF